ncbi:MAG: hypothetical protein KAJ91_04715, partial [Candidatus Aenigmarchaeota archaeon]|nr:hypothetical protein [Candidatus Aenigmarchaeota archaeon]
FIVWGKTNISVSQMHEFYANGITQSSGVSFALQVNVTNNGPANAYAMNISLDEDPSGSLSYNTTFVSCNNIAAGQNCSGSFLVTVPAGTPPQIISLFANASWREPDNLVNMTFNTTTIYVASNPLVNIFEAGLQQNTPHNRLTQVGNVTTVSDGNDALEDVQLSFIGGDISTECPLCVLEILPGSQGILFAGTNFTSTITVDVPFGQAPGTYWTYLRASTSNDGYDQIMVNITVPLNTSWQRTPATFGTLLTPPNTSGQIGDVISENIGNLKLFMSVWPTGDDPTLVSYHPNAFTLGVGAEVTTSMNYTIPEDKAEGLYYFGLVIQNSTATPMSYTTTVWLNVTDLPPNITNEMAVPGIVEAGFENTTVSATITDNIAVASAWLNITLPDNSTLLLGLARNNTYYSTAYNATAWGVHNIRVCSNDTAGNTGCAPAINLLSSANTTFNVSSNMTNMTVANITIYSGQNISVNFTMDNTGHSRAYSPNLSVATPENWSFVPNNFSYSTLLKNTSSVEYDAGLYVPPATAPGYYNINFTLNWTNLDGTNETSVLQVPVYVAPNPVVDIVEQNITIIVDAGDSSYENITLNSTGNAALSGVSFNCTEGAVCNNFTIEYIPSNITSLEVGNFSIVAVNVSVPIGYPPATYNGTLRAYTNTSYDEATVFVLIPLDLSWQHTPTYLGMDVVQGMNGTLGIVDVKNIGNLQLLLSTSITGNSSYFGVNSSSLSINPLEEKSVLVKYYAPEATSIQEYTAYFKT